MYFCQSVHCLTSLLKLFQQWIYPVLDDLSFTYFLETFLICRYNSFYEFLYTGMKLLHSFCLCVSLFVASLDSDGPSLATGDILLVSGVNFETSGLVFFASVSQFYTGRNLQIQSIPVQVNISENKLECGKQLLSPIIEVLMSTKILCTLDIRSKETGILSFVVRPPEVLLESLWQTNQKINNNKTRGLKSWSPENQKVTRPEVSKLIPEHRNSKVNM